MTYLYPHLHVYSAYSLLEGLAAPAELAQAAAAHGLPALALTDHHRLSGAIEFYDACRTAGVQPILGLAVEVLPPAELAAAPAGTLTLLAMDREGWANLCRISSASFSETGDIQPAPLDLIQCHAAGLLCLSGGRGGLAARLLAQGQTGPARVGLERLRAIFPGRLYAELQLHTPADSTWVVPLVTLAARLGLPTAATHSVYYLDPAQAALQRVAAAIRLNRPLDSLTSADLAPPEAFFLPPAEMARRFAAYPSSLANLAEIANRCRLELPLGQPHFPKPDLPPGVTAIQELRRKAQAGAIERYGAEQSPVVQQRLEHELAVIETCGYEALFLVMQEIVDFARRSGIPIASRGSASSSLAAHCLGITTPDPVRLNLYFERFLNPARATPPDIDTDLCSRRRDEVIRFVYRRFGADRVAMVCTVNRFRRRSALREAAKAFGLPPAQVSALAESLPHRWYGPPDRSRNDEQPFAELRAHYPDPLHRQIFEAAAALIGRPRHLSIHPGGIVIAPGPLTDLAPTQMAAKGIVATQLDLDSIERLGLVKLDLLGIRGLTVLGDVARAIQADQANPLLVLESIPEDDPEVSALVERGGTIGCFQIESPGMRATLREIHARRVDDILAALALYRPGPLTGGQKNAFVARYRGLEPIKYPHPALEGLLNDTFGVILYQEQVLRIAHELGGFSLAEADLLRRAMSHFDPGKQMQALKERFIAGAFERRGVPGDSAERIWEMMAAFAGYGFPKAHAASYAKVAWQSAWCKLHHPAHFLAAVLANWGGYYGQQVYLTEARRLDLAVRPPLVNAAQPEFSVQPLDGRSTLVMGMNQVRELTHRTQERILRYRPFASLADFLARADPRPAEAENLARAGALEGFGSIPAILRRLALGGWRGGQLPLFDLAPTAPANAIEAGDPPDWSLAEKAAAQERILGVSLAAHPLELCARPLAAARALSTVEAAARLGQPVRVAGMRQTWRRAASGQGAYTYFMSLEDLEGMLEVVIPGGVYQQARSGLSGPGPYVIEGVVELDAERGEPFIRAEKIWPLG